VTAGPTYEKIDPVRFLGNRSSGLMGFSLAEEAAERGGEVTLITGPVGIKLSHSNVKRIDVTSAEEMHDECLKHAPSAHIIIMAAAVSDFRITVPGIQKIKRSGTPLTLKLEPVPDILKDLSAKKKKNQFLIGFALETDHELENARKKLSDKNLDMVVLNSLKDEGAGFGTSTNRVTLLMKNGKVLRGGMKTKKEVAADIFNAVKKIKNHA
jgi:phosphopantothenoylcysteine decarboxylase/phosphopantothenate--cysteine ligase